MKNPAIPDEQLVIEFRNSSDEQILDELVKRHLARVRAMTYAMVFNNADADDLTQEIFVRAIRGLDGFRGRSLFSTWLNRIVMNTVRTFLSKRRLSAVPISVFEESLASRASSPVETAIAKESLGMLDGEVGDALGSLKPKLRAAVVLVILHGMSPQEAAETEGCAVATMHWRIHRAKKLLKSRLKRST